MNFEWLSPPPAANMIKRSSCSTRCRPLTTTPGSPSPSACISPSSRWSRSWARRCWSAASSGRVERCAVSAYLQVQTLWVSPQGRQKRLDECRDRFAVAEGDAVTALNIHTAWCKAGGAQGGGRARSFADKTCSRTARWSGLRISGRSSPGRSQGGAGGFLRRRICARASRDDRRFLRERRRAGTSRGRAEGSAFRSVRGGATLFIHPGRFVRG